MEHSKCQPKVAATNSHSLLAELKRDTASLENCLTLSDIVKHVTITGPSNSIPMWLLKTYVHTKTCIWMFIGLTIAQISINWQMNK